jgi:hypothetical protein
MKRLILIPIVLILIMPYSNAQLWKQTRYEVSGAIGTTQFFGDVGGYSIGSNTIGFKDFSLRQTRFTIGGSVKYWFLDDVAGRLNISYLALHGTDVRGSNTGRGFISTTTVVETYIGGEYYFIRNKARNSYLYLRGRKSITPLSSLLDVYAMVGLGWGVYNVDPNEVLALEIKKSHGVCAIFPVGAGVSFLLSPSISIGTELTSHFALTDYLDGYTSKFSARNDLFYTLDFKFNYKFAINFKKQGGLPYSKRR